MEGLSSTCLQISKDVPQGSILGPLHFIIYIKNLDKMCHMLNFFFYPDDTFLYCPVNKVQSTLEKLQTAFNVVQCGNLGDLKLVFNADKSKEMSFSNTKFMFKPQLLPSNITFQGSQIEVVSQYKYLGFIIYVSLAFVPHIQKLVKK